MSVFKGCFEAFTRLPAGLIVSHMVAKFIFGVGLGVLISGSVGSREPVGWVLIIVAVIIAIPSASKLIAEMVRS